MFYPNRICMPFTIGCNFSCQYCYRDTKRRPVPERATDEFLQYLKGIQAPTYAVVASGGEPLLNFAEIQRVFAVVPRHIHLKIMTNGSLFTKDIVDWANKNKVEMQVSHDGRLTKELRGMDILENARLLELVQNIHYLHITPTLTNRNPDIMEVYGYIKEKLKRPFYFYPNVVFESPCNARLIEGFDYDVYARSFAEYIATAHESMRGWYVPGKPTYSGKKGFNVLLDGTVVGMNTLTRYGTVWDEEADIYKAYEKEERAYCEFCKSRKCPIREECGVCMTTASEHTCRIEEIDRSVYQNLREGGFYEYFRNGH